MKLNKPENENYAAVVVKVPAVIKLEGLDNVRGVPLFGMQAIVGKETSVGDIGIVFPAETQLSEEYCKENNLFRDATKNKDKNKTGYLEQNRRVKAMKFQKQVSNCLFMPLDSLKFTKVKLEELSEGDLFDELANHAICRKYLVKQPVSRVQKNVDKGFVRVESKFMPEHYDSDNFYRNAHAIKDGTQVIVTQKLHGTSIRIGHTIVKRKLKLHEQIAKRLGVKVQETEFDYIYGSRKVIKDPNNPNSVHFYGYDIWSEEGKRLEGLIPQNYLVYAELIGYSRDGGEIQKNYSYNTPHGTSELYVYRVAFINAEGAIVDLSFDQMVEWCKLRNIKTVPELWRGDVAELKKIINKRTKKMAIERDWTNRRFAEMGLNALPLAPESEVDEGVCVRVDGIAPYVLKAKSSIFLEHESKLNDKGVVDLESEGSLSE